MYTPPERAGTGEDSQPRVAASDGGRQSEGGNEMAKVPKRGDGTGASGSIAKPVDRDTSEYDGTSKSLRVKVRGSRCPYCYDVKVEHDTASTPMGYRITHQGQTELIVSSLLTKDNQETVLEYIQDWLASHHEAPIYPEIPSWIGGSFAPDSFETWATMEVRDDVPFWKEFERR